MLASDARVADMAGQAIPVYHFIAELFGLLCSIPLPKDPPPSTLLQCHVLAGNLFPVPVSGDCSAAVVCMKSVFAGGQDNGTS